MLGAVILLCKLQDQSYAVANHEGEKMIQILEKQGDLCSSLKAFPRAVDFYEKMLQVGAPPLFFEPNLT